MAIIKLGIALSEIRGSVGGTTFARNRYGAYARNRTKPKEPVSDPWEVIKQIFSGLVMEWHTTLTDPERQSWADCAAMTPLNNALGDRMTLTALAMFLRSNVLRVKCGLTYLAEAPHESGLIDMPSITFVSNVTVGVTISNVSPAQAAGDAMTANVSPFLRPTRQYWKGPWPLFLSHAGAFAAAWELKAPATVIEGDEYVVRLRKLSAIGQVSQDYLFRTVVGAAPGP